MYIIGTHIAGDATCKGALLSSLAERGLGVVKVRFSLYKIVFHFKALLWESIILILPPAYLQSLH